MNTPGFLAIGIGLIVIGLGISAAGVYVLYLWANLYSGGG